MWIGAVRAEFRLRGVRSLKEKRAPLRSLKDRVAARFRCAVAEVALQEKHQRAVLGAALVSASESHLRDAMRAVRRAFETDAELECLRVDERVYEGPGAEEEGDEWGAPPGTLFLDLDAPDG